ncbi:MAG: glycosyltransferase family 4 protein [Blastocatellia bacterium]|jgi:glycosyltransferase involved in cell wall biosynthesis
MKILYLTAGAAGMYCGSCLRDNALAAELLRQGHDVNLLPLYTPPLTDEPGVSNEKVFFGGISVYLEQHSAIFRHTPRWLDRIWDSRRALLAASKRSIAVDPDSLGELTISMLRGEHGRQRKEVGKLIDWLSAEKRRGFEYDVVDMQNSMLLGLAKPIREAIGRPICCTLQGEDLFLDGLREPFRREALELIREHSRHVDAFIAVSQFYAERMTEYLRIPREKVHVVRLGINLTDYDARPAVQPVEVAEDRPFTIGYFARIAPEKGLHLLVDAFCRLREKSGGAPMRLEAAGYLAPEHHGYLREVEERLEEAGLAADFRYHGKLDRAAKLDFFRRIDLLSMPTTYPEPKGLPVLEAMASGVPVIQPNWGSFPEMIDRTGGGLLFTPNDGQALAERIRELWINPELARDLGRRGHAGVHRYYQVESMAGSALDVYSAVSAQSGDSAIA